LVIDSHLSRLNLRTIDDQLSNEVGDTKHLICLRREFILKKLQKYGRETPLRVLIGSNSLACGGAEHQILRLMPHLIALGLDVEHFYYGAPHVLKDKFKEKGLLSRFFDRDALGQLCFWWKTVSMIRNSQFDVVHAFSETANFYVRGAAILARTPVVIAGWRSRKMSQGLRWRLPISLLNIFTNAWVINAPTNAEALSGLWAMKNLPVYVVPNALDLYDQNYSVPCILPSELAAWINGRTLVGTVGRIADAKNFDMFLDVAKCVAAERDDVCFCLIGGPAGDPPTVALDQHLRRRIDVEGMGGFMRMTGRMDDVAGFLPNLTVMLCTSDYEGCPNAVMEGLRAGLPVVMTDCCDTTPLIDQGKSGYVVPLRDVAAMESKLNELLDDKEKRLSFGDQARKLAEHTFAAESNAWKLALIYLTEWEKKVGLKITI